MTICEMPSILFAVAMGLLMFGTTGLAGLLVNWREREL